MVARADTSRLTSAPPRPTLAAVAALVTGGLVALACLAGPIGLLETVVVRSGLAALVNAAAPPLGLTARGALALGGGVLVAAVSWAIVVLALGDRRVPNAWPALRIAPFPLMRGRRGVAVRRADSHPDAPPRPPILAERDLGAPFLSICASVAEPQATAGPAPVQPESPPASDERTLPADLDTALAAIDPAAIPASPREPVRPVPPLAAPTPARERPRPMASPPLMPGERIDSIELGPEVRDQPDSIESLLARLERGARRRPLPKRELAAEGEVAVSPPAAGSEAEPARRAGSLEDTLGSLRRLATNR